MFFNGTCSLSQSSSSTIVFIMLLPLVLVSKIGVNPEDAHFQFIVELYKIVKIILASVITHETKRVTLTLPFTRPHTKKL